MPRPAFPPDLTLTLPLTLPLTQTLTLTLTLNLTLTQTLTLSLPTWRHTVDVVLLEGGRVCAEAQSIQPRAHLSEGEG